MAVLLLHANEIVPTDRLIDLVWPESPPRTAVHSIQIYVSELRKAIEPLAGCAAITTRPPGYVLEADPESIDADRFTRLVADGLRRLGAGEPGGSVTVLRSALALWGGPPLSDFTYEEFAQAHIRRLSELRLAALEELAAAELDLGRAVQALPLIESAIATDALREWPSRCIGAELTSSTRPLERPATGRSRPPPNCPATCDDSCGPSVSTATSTGRWRRAIPGAPTS